MIAGTLFIVAAPSGAGKTTLVGRLLAEDPHVQHSISFTTRAPRAGEQNGREYHFIDVQHFLAMRERGEFAEWAEVHDNFYGTSRVWLEQRMQEGCDMLLEIDWQGAQQIRARLPEAIDVFVLPPSRAALGERLAGRRTDSPEVIARRLRDSVTELSHWPEFRYVIVNDEFERALEDLERIVAGDARGLERARPGLATFASSLLD